MKTTLKFSLVAAVLAITGCTAPEPIDPARMAEAQRFVSEFANKIGPAVFISNECPNYRMNPAEESKLQYEMLMEMSERGIAPREVDRALDTAQSEVAVLRSLVEYSQRRNVQLDDRASICRAGDYERRNNTAIGKMLVRI